MQKSPQYRRTVHNSRKPTYAIICDARGGSRLGIRHLARVDLSLLSEGTKKHWTSDSPEQALELRSKEVAQHMSDGYEHNNARVVLFSEAVLILKAQAKSIAEMQDKDRDGQGGNSE
jgi:hypothetical protein